MQFQFETLDVYQKTLDLYRGLSGNEAGNEHQSARWLKRSIIELCQSMITGASCWSREHKVRYFQNSLDKARCLVPLVDGAAADGVLSAEKREALREEIENICKMLSSLTRWTRDWAEKTIDDERSGKSGNQSGSQVIKTRGTER